LSHPFVERLIGTIRREYLDHVLFWTAADLETKLSEFKNYYNRYRSHGRSKVKLRSKRQRREAHI
jgi:putative transposase